MNGNERKYKSPFQDKRIILIYIIVIIAILSGVTYALQSSSITFSLMTATIGIDEAAYGKTTFDSKNLDMIPISDNDVEEKVGASLKIDFTVGGASDNNADLPIIYDIALVDLDMHCNLLSTQFKWKLVKNGIQISSGTFSYTFDTIKDGRLVLTNTQQDLPAYNSMKEGYDKYSFYIWISDVCQEEDLTICSNNTSMTKLLNKAFSGKIEVELYTGSKKALVRNPTSTIDYKTCTADSFTKNINYKNSVQPYTVPYPGYYTLIAYGGVGGGSSSAYKGKGGMVKGTIYLEADTTIYIVTGGTGSKTSGGYNGGGNGGANSDKSTSSGYGGGGATHIATTNRGTLTNYQNYTSEILLVAGGGGGSSGQAQGDSLGDFAISYVRGGNSDSHGGSSSEEVAGYTFSTGQYGYRGTKTAGGEKGARQRSIIAGSANDTSGYSGGGGGGGGGYYGGGGGAGGLLYYSDQRVYNNYGTSGTFGKGGNGGIGTYASLCYHATAGGGGGGGANYISDSLTNKSTTPNSNNGTGRVIIEYLGKTLS